MVSKKALEGLVEGDLVELKYFPGPRFLYKERTQPFYFIRYTIEEGIEMIKVFQEKNSCDMQNIPLDKIDKITKYVPSKE